jgi:hypothetical protein
MGGNMEELTPFTSFSYNSDFPDRLLAGSVQTNSSIENIYFACSEAYIASGWILGTINAKIHYNYKA